MMLYIKLAKANFTNGYFFNLGMAYTNLIAGNGDQIKIQLGFGGEMYEVRINRKDNPNQTPRIMAGKKYKYWVHANYNLGDQMKVQIVSINFLILLAKRESL